MRLSKEQILLLRGIQRRFNSEAKLTLNVTIKELRKREVLALEHIIDSSSAAESCPHCGTSEMLCGHLGVGCTSIKH